jgi:RNA polymerase sigma factor (sigma-70 family)
MLQQHIIDGAPSLQHNSETIPNPIPPDDFDASADELAELLTRWTPRYTRLVREAFRHLWDRGELRELAKLYKAVHAKFLAKVEAGLPEPSYDAEDQIHQKAVLDQARKRIYDQLAQATSGNTKALRAYFRESSPLTDEQRQHFGRLWNATEDKLRHRAKLINPKAQDELLSDTVARLVKQDVFSTLAPDYAPEHFLWLAYRCMRMAHRKGREEKRRARYQVGRYLVRKGKPDTVGKMRSRVVEFVERMEALSILLEHIAALRSDRRRDAVISYYLEDETTKEIAQRWESPEHSVNQACNRAVHDLRPLVPASLDPGGYTSEQMSARMTKLRHRGETWSNIGDKFGITRKAVEKRVKRFEEMAVAR